MGRHGLRVPVVLLGMPSRTPVALTGTTTTLPLGSVAGRRNEGDPVTTTATDPRALQLAESRYRNGYGATSEDAWDQLDASLRQHLIGEAAAWLRAAIEAGLMPPAERPTDKHMAVYLDEEGLLYGEYDGDDILRLVWVSEQAQSKRELEVEHGAEFRLIGWSE